jgi:hypothetical protein
MKVQYFLSSTLGVSSLVTSVVQTELRERGYYQGPINGVIDADSRRAIVASKPIEDCR